MNEHFIKAYVEEVAIILVLMVNDRMKVDGNSLTHHPIALKRFE